MTRAIVLSLLAALALGCGGEEEPDAREEAFSASVRTIDEARELRRRGLAPSRAQLLRAYELGLRALRLPGERPRLEILNHLANVCVDLGEISPEHLGRAMRFADHAMRKAPDWIVPRFNLGVAYARAGLLEQAARTFRGCLEMRDQILEEHPEAGIEDPGARAGLVAVLVSMANRALARDRVDAELTALRAARILPDGAIIGVTQPVPRIKPLPSVDSIASLASAVIVSGVPSTIDS